MERNSQKWIPAAGRILLGAIFVLSGLGKIATWQATLGYMASKGMPASNVLLGLTVALEVLGGLSVVTGIGARWAAPLLAAYLVPTTLIFHNFWAAPDAEKQMQMANFMKNISIIGGLLMAHAYETVSDAGRPDQPKEVEL
jgi:putative oxidoreductase